jgi:hypothetical protein
MKHQFCKLYCKLHFGELFANPHTVNFARTGAKHIPKIDIAASINNKTVNIAFKKICVSAFFFCVQVFVKYRHKNR